MKVRYNSTSDLRVGTPRCHEVSSGQARASARATTPTPNPSIERTRSGSAGLALISFWAKPAPPPRAAHVERWASFGKIANHDTAENRLRRNRTR